MIIITSSVIEISSSVTMFLMYILC